MAFSAPLRQRARGSEGGAPAGPFAGVREHLEGRRQTARWWCPLPREGWCSSSRCLSLPMRIKIERNGAASAAAHFAGEPEALCREKEGNRGSAPEMTSAAARLATAADNASAEAQSLVVDMCKALNSMKSLAVDYEKAGKTDKAKQLEEEVLELMASYEDCAHLAEAVKEVPGTYKPSDQATDFRKLIEAEVNKVKGNSRVSEDSQQLIRQFRVAVWDVHHAGQPMPGDEQEDLVMTNTQGNILNFQCPITMKPVIELTNPVRSIDCRHIYDKDPIIRHIRLSKAPKCPVAGCPKVLHVARLVCDAYLRAEIDELRSSSRGASNAADVEDIEDDDEDPMEDGDNE